MPSHAIDFLENSIKLMLIPNDATERFPDIRGEMSKI